MAIEERIKKAIAKALGNKKVFERLEESSGIKASSWQAMLYGRQRATSEMIEFICRKLPEYAYWIATGFIPNNGVKHKSPEEKNKLDKVFTIEELLKKEGVDLTENEFEWLYEKMVGYLKREIKLEENVFIAINIVVRSKTESKKVEDVINELKKDAWDKTIERAVLYLEKIRNAKEN